MFQTSIFAREFYERPASAFGWWFSKLWVYNLGLVASGVMAGLATATVSSWKWDKIAAAATAAGELPEFNVFLSGAIYLVMMAVANVCYQGGMVIEWVVRPRDRAAFRRIVFLSGSIFSVALPFLVPLLILVRLW